MPERQYSESEVRRIIEAATRQRGGAAEGGEGLTLAEIERVGQESGIDPAHLRAAARALDEGGPTAVEDEGRFLVARRTLPGTLGDAEWGAFTAELEDLYRPNLNIFDYVRGGNPVRPPRPGIREWREKALEPQTVARATETMGETHVVLRRLVPSFSLTDLPLSASLFIAAVVGFIAWLQGYILYLSPFLGPLAALLTLATTAPLAWHYVRRVRDRETEQLRRVVSALHSTDCRSGVGGATPPEARTDPAPSADNERGGVEPARARQRVR